jgi:hypothetical protein
MNRRSYGLLWMCLLFCGNLFAQQTPVAEGSLEAHQELSGTSQEEVIVPESEGELILDLNAGDVGVILSSVLLTPVQAQALLKHRERYGRLLDIGELQVVEGFDTSTIRRLRPMLRCNSPVLDERFHPSELLAAARHELLFRVRRNLHDKKGFRSDGNFPFYTGDANQIYLRYKMTSGRYFSAGVVMEKDAGERMFARSNGGRMDFFSWHVFLRPSVKIRALAIGDYQVQFGQGLVAWNGISLGKSTEVHQIYRRGLGLRPYSSAGESGFNRGVAISLGKKVWTYDFWVSYRKLDASLFPVDTTFTLFEVSSIQTSGLHRTYDEIGNRALLGQFISGAHLQREKGRWRHEFTTQLTSYETALWPGDDPYELYDPDGKLFIANGISSRFLLPNGSLYAEVAADKEGDVSMLSGIVLMPDKVFTLSLQYRRYSKAFQSPGADALREGSRTQNEQGLFCGGAWQLHQQLRLQGYLDVFRFPWLRFTTSEPVDGKEWLLQLTYLPSRTTELYIRYRQEEKPTDQVMEGWKIPENGVRKNLRVNLQWMYGKNMEFSSRGEWVRQIQGDQRSEGILFYQEIRYKPLGKPYSFAARWSVFKTGGYDARIYSYEQDMAGSFSLPAYYDAGSRYYFLVRYRLSRGLDLWIRFGSTVYPDPAFTDENGELPEPRQELKGQIRWQF